MPKNKNPLETVHELHKSGQLDAAKKGYLTLLKQFPNNSDILHALGILCIQQDNSTDAVAYLKKAHQLEPNNPNLQLHFANALKLQGLFQQAVEVLKATIKNYPEYVAAYNNLGTVYYLQEHIDDAIAVYQIAIEKQANYVDAYYNLGLAYAKKMAWREAISAYKTLLDYAPNHFAARFHLACGYMQQHNFTAAIAEFLLIDSMHAHHFETQSNLATCYLRQGALTLARDHYINAIKIHPDDTQILFNLGYIYTQIGDLDQAIPFYQRTLQINPDLFAAHNNLGVAFIAKQHVGFALHHFQEALRLQPDNQAIAYTVQSLAQNKRLLSAPPDYVQTLFDAYADHYETHLIDALDYQLPKLMMQTLSGIIKPNILLNIVDLGCGTGLCGALLKPYAKSLTGVDLSKNMLAIAHEKKIYDQLIQQDFMSYLTNTTHTYDLITAGDVLVYLGELDTLFTLIKRSLNPKGLFFFNIERTETDDYKMNQSGRFSHNMAYITTLATQLGFKIIRKQECVTRMQNNEPVNGQLYLLQH